jgi:hypothetical protein
MLRTKSLISTLTEVPRTWVFEYYLELKEKLTGQDIKIKSIFSKTDKNPSFCVYYSSSTSCYKFKDFATSKQGDGVTLVQLMFELSSRGEAAHKIIEDYNQFMLTNKEDYQLREFKVHSKYQVAGFDKRAWTNIDEKYWMKFHINSKLLEEYCVYPLQSYRMTKEDEGETKELLIKGDNIYGYFRKDGTLYKIYQPMVKENKFIKVKEYIQGSEQLTGNVPYLVICSSLKDLMAFRKLGYNNAEAIAPDSENTLIPEQVLLTYRHKYKKIVTLFDNDTPGIDAMKKYELRYSIPYVHLNMSKDLSDSVRDNTLTKVRDTLTPLLKQVVYNSPILKSETV